MERKNKNPIEPNQITILKNGKLKTLKQPYSPEQAKRFRDGDIK